MIREVSPVGIGGKEWPSEEVMDAESIVMMTKMGWQVNDKVNWDKNGEADEMDLRIWKLIPKTWWCLSKWATCDFQRQDGC